MKVRRYLLTYPPTYLPNYLLDRRFLTYIPLCWASLPALEPKKKIWGGGGRGGLENRHQHFHRCTQNRAETLNRHGRARHERPGQGWARHEQARHERIVSERQGYPLV